MPLPSINSNLPKYTLTIPSTGQSVKYRPFMIGEQKLMLMAKEGGDTDEMATATNEVIRRCLDGDVDVDRLAYFDFTYIFIMLRAKGVGETATPHVTCATEGCENTVKIKIDLTEVKIALTPGHTPRVDLTDEYGVVMRYPTMAMMGKLTEVTELTTLDMITDCIESVYDDKQQYAVVDHSPEEFQTFIDALLPEQLTKINTFFQTMPALKHEVEYKCSKCKKKHTVTLRTFDDFFTQG